MRWLLAGFAVPYGALYAWGVIAAPAWLRQEWTSQRVFCLTLLIVPLASAWGAAEITHVLSPRRLLDRRLTGRRAPGVRVARWALGLAAGCMGAIGAAVALPLAEPYVNDATVTGGTAAPALGGAVLLMKRRRPGHCVFCGYDLRDGPGPGRAGSGVCPECGALAMVGMMR